MTNAAVPKVCERECYTRNSIRCCMTIQIHDQTMPLFHKRDDHRHQGTVFLQVHVFQQLVAWLVICCDLILYVYLPSFCRIRPTTSIPCASSARPPASLPACQSGHSLHSKWQPVQARATLRLPQRAISTDTSAARGEIKG